MSYLQTFYTDPCIFTWDEYFEIYVRGCNKYILKEDESQYEKSKKTLQRYYCTIFFKTG